MALALALALAWPLSMQPMQIFEWSLPMQQADEVVQVVAEKGVPVAMVRDTRRPEGVCTIWRSATSNAKVETLKKHHRIVKFGKRVSRPEVGSSDAGTPIIEPPYREGSQGGRRCRRAGRSLPSPAHSGRM